MNSCLNVTENSFIIRFGSTDKVDKEVNALFDSWDQYFDFIHSSHKQMTHIFNDYNDDNESRIFKTPRRVSNRRKRSSALNISAVRTQQEVIGSPRRVSKRKVSSAFTTRELFPTPRRVSKRGKSSTINKTNIECIEAFNLESDQNQNNIKNDQIIQINTPLELFSELSLKENEVQVEVENEKKIENEIKVDKNNESDKEWMTDDEEPDEKMETEEFFDANDEEKERNELKRKMNTSIDAKKMVPNLTSKPKKKKISQYFTPQTTISRSSRAKTRMQSRIVNSSRNNLETTPQTINNNSRLNTGSKSATITRQMEVNITSSGETNPQKYGSSSRSMRYVSRINKQTSDTKTLTASAAKRRQEEDEKRRLRLEASQEKEKRAIEKRQQLIEQTVSEKKFKSQQKFNRAAEQRELHKLKEEEKLKKEQEKREEQEKKLKKLEEERREVLRKKNEEIMKKTLENERRKQLQELKEAKIKLQKQEELKRKQELEKERLEEQERMTAMIKQHNNSLQQKAVAHSFLKKCENNMNPKVVIHKISPLQNTETKEKTNVSPDEPIVGTKSNKTFVVEKDEVKACETSVYDMTPPPKEHNYDNYDISGIKSDDDTDDECKPRKKIPNWARGSQFVETLKQQYAKSFKSKEREIRYIFSVGVKFPVELGLIFGTQRSVAAKYSKRTSSAVWNSPPTLNTNISLNSTHSDISFINKN